jgi:uncharacterized protein
VTYEPTTPYGMLAAFVLNNRKAVSAALFVIVGVAALLGLPPRVSSDLLALMPENSEAANSLRALNEEEGGLNLLTLAFSSDDPEHLSDFLSGTVSELESMDSVRHAIHDVDPDLAFEIALLQLEPEDVDELTVRLKGALALGPALNPIVTQRLMAMGPLTEKIANADNTSMLGNKEGTGRILVRPSGPSSDQSFTVPFMEEVDAMLDRRLAAQPDVEMVWMGGAYRHTVEDVIGIKNDIAVTSLAASVMVLLIVVLAFRSLRATILVLVPLAAANIVNLAVVNVAIGHLNTYTSFATAILIGLGIDFAVHLVGRYREQRSTGLSVEDAIVTAWDRVGPPCATAALTSAAGFLALAAAQFRGFSQLGVVLAVGLLVCLFLMYVILPLLIPVLDASPKVLLGSQVSGDQPSRSTYRMAPLGLMIAVLFTGFIGASRLPQIAWEFDMSALRRDGMGYAELSEQERALAKDSYSPIIVSYPTSRALAVDHARLNHMAEHGELQWIAKVVSVENVLPVDQLDRLDSLKNLQHTLFGYQKADGSIGPNPNLRYLPPAFVKQLLPLNQREMNPLTRDDLPAGLLTALGATSEDKHRILLFPRGNMWDMRQADKLAQEVKNEIPRRKAAGEHLFAAEMYRYVLADIPIVGSLALLMVAALTFIDLKRPLWVAGALFTLLAGMIWAGSAISIVGVNLSMLNVVGIPMLLGIGVDVVIHLLHRLREEGPGGVRKALRTTGVAALISTTTTVFSFCSLMLAGSRGIRSLGLLVVIGLVAVFLAGATLLPLAWAAGWKLSGQAPGDSDQVKP